MILNFGPHFPRTSTTMASCILDPALALFLCSRVLHVKYRLLPKDLLTLEDIGEGIAKDYGTCHQLADATTETKGTFWFLCLCHPLFAIPRS
jgi:hypothetical protein